MKAGIALQAASNVVAAAFGVFVGLSMSGFPGIEDWLLKWQNLVTGVLAIIAAAMTILAMMWVDEKQQFRHRQLMEMGIQRDKLRVARIAYQYPTSARSLKKETASLKSHVGEFGFVEGTAMRMRAVADAVLKLEATLSVRDVSDLFSPRLSYALVSIKEHCEFLKKWSEIVEDVRRGKRPADEREIALEGIERDLQGLATSLDHVATELEDLGRRYQ